MSTIDLHTVKVTLEGEPAFVEATTARLKEFFAVTYVSKDQHVKLTGRVKRYLHMAPPALAHGEGFGGQGLGDEKPAPESEEQ